MRLSVKAKSGLASPPPSVTSFSNKTQGNSPHFLLELVVADLYTLKLRGDKTRVHTSCCRDPAPVWFGCLAAHLFLSPLTSSEVGECSRLRPEAWHGLHHLLRHTPQVLDFRLPWRRRESTCCGDEDLQTSGRHACNWSRVCVHMSSEAFYLCCLSHRYNRHRIVSRSGNTNLSLTSDHKETLDASLDH